MNRYVIREQIGMAMTAASKAHADVEHFLNQRGFRRLTVRVHDLEKQGLLDKVRRHYGYLTDWLHIYNTIEPQSLLLIQYPLKLNAPLKEPIIRLLRKQKQVKTVFLIHDLETLRSLEGQGYDEQEEQHLDEMSDAIICHNDAMRTYLIEKGVDERKLFTLELFDYHAEPLVEERRPTVGSVIVAGNLDPQKSVYVYDLHTIPDVRFDLYGVRYQQDYIHENVQYHGAFKPEELPHVMEGAFGLVWDGTSVDTCEGNTGNYLRYNNPHKLSLYLASGIPVIVWERAAVAEFVKRFGVGLCVSSLHDLPNLLETISPADLRRMLHNTAWLSEKITSGAFLNRVMDEIEATLFE